VFWHLSYDRTELWPRPACSEGLEPPSLLIRSPCAGIRDRSGQSATSNVSPAGCSCSSGFPLGRSFRWLPAWLPKATPLPKLSGGFQLVASLAQLDRAAKLKPGVRGGSPGNPLRSARGGYPADVATGLIAGLLGIFGTVVGGVLATWNARHTADRTAWRAREELRRQEFRSAIVQFAAALLVYRTAEMDRWHARHGGFRDEPSAAADVYRARTAVWNALYVLKLSTDDRELCQEARRAIEQAETIKYPDSQAEMDLRADQVQDDLDKVITMAQLAKPGRSQSLDVR
jgi:hypothetical protein